MYWLVGCVSLTGWSIERARAKGPTCRCIVGISSRSARILLGAHFTKRKARANVAPETQRWDIKRSLGEGRKIRTRVIKKKKYELRLHTRHLYHWDVTTIKIPTTESLVTQRPCVWLRPISLLSPPFFPHSWTELEWREDSINRRLNYSGKKFLHTDGSRNFLVRRGIITFSWVHRDSRLPRNKAFVRNDNSERGFLLLTGVSRLSGFKQIDESTFTASRTMSEDRDDRTYNVSRWKIYRKRLKIFRTISHLHSRKERFRAILLHVN